MKILKKRKKRNHRMEGRRRHVRRMRNERWRERAEGEQEDGKKKEEVGGKNKGFEKCQDCHGIIYSLFQVASKEHARARAHTHRHTHTHGAPNI